MLKSKFQKLYFPGLISLLGLPLMCIWYLLSNQAFYKQNGMEVAWQSDASLKEWAKFSHEKIDIRRVRKYKELSLTGNKLHDIDARKDLIASITLLEKKADTINGIRISLQAHTRYEEIVDILDVCDQDENKNINAMPYNNTILIWYNSPRAYAGDRLKYLLVDDVIIHMPDQPETNGGFNMLLSNSINAIRLFWPSILLFLMMIYFTVFKKRRYIKIATSTSDKY
jgi:hypothetical protein